MTDWRASAACAEPDVDPNLFFADSQGAQPHAAQKVCRRCPVQQQCAEFAVRNHIRHGVWGGLTDKKRRALATSAGR